MSYIAIKDLVDTEALDREALTRIHGGGEPTLEGAPILESRALA